MTVVFDNIQKKIKKNNLILLSKLGFLSAEENNNDLCTIFFPNFNNLISGSFGVSRTWILDSSIIKS